MQNTRCPYLLERVAYHCCTANKLYCPSNLYLKKYCITDLCEPCPYCEGRGFIKSSVTVCYEIFREIRRISQSSKEKKIMVSVNPEVADLLYDEERQGVEDLEMELKKKLIIKADATLHQEQYDIVMV